MNYTASVDLKKVKGACIIKVKGKSATKTGIFLPFDDSDLIIGNKGVYLSMSIRERSDDNKLYGNTHSIRQNVDAEKYKGMSDEERKAIPFLGDMRPIQTKIEEEANQSQSVVAMPEDENEGLSF